MRTLRILAPLALVVVLVAACGSGGGSSTKVPSSAVAIVGSDSVTRDAFNGLLTQAQRTYKAQKRTYARLAR